MTLRHALLIGLALAAGALAYGAYRWHAGPAVAIALPERGPAVQAIYATGTVEPVEWAKVEPLVTARIVEICACEGRAVAVGEELARLDDAEARARLAELEAQRSFLASEVERTRTLLQKRFVSPQLHEQTTSRHQQAVAAVAAAKERLGQYVLRAPLDGTVLRKDGEVGEVVGPGDIVFWIGRLRPLWIVTEVDEEDIPQVALGQRALIRADAFPDRDLPGRVEKVTPKGDPINKSYRVRVALPDDTPLLIGMTTEVNIVVREENDAILVPVTALANGRVWLVEDGRTVARPVELGVIGTEKAEVRAGLSGDESVILDPPPDLRENDRVRPQPIGDGAPG
ncbi:MAG: efflux RND transporter periplasmic adaptor subunit [Rhodospirillaceae bacterium]|nr:efflux RND transporter periplasmic adaptor subunit [Rhodospirillaceae bacterium]